MESVLKVAKYIQLLCLCKKTFSGFRLHCLDGQWAGWKGAGDCAVVALARTSPAVLAQPSPAVPKAAVQHPKWPCPLSPARGPKGVSPAHLLGYLPMLKGFQPPLPMVTPLPGRVTGPVPVTQGGGTRSA